MSVTEETTAESEGVFFEVQLTSWQWANLVTAAELYEKGFHEKSTYSEELLDAIKALKRTKVVFSPEFQERIDTAARASVEVQN